MGHRVEPFVDGARQLRLALADAARHLGLAAGQHVAHGLDADRRLRLQTRHLGDLAFRRLAVALALRTQRDHGDQAPKR